MNETIHAPQGEIIIRAATLDDAAALRELRLEALTGNPIAFGADPAKTAAEPPEAWAERIARNEAGEEGMIAVAEAGGGLIGMAGLEREHWPKTRHAAFIWGVYVRPGWRGRHVAEALLSECLAWARGHGVVVAKLGVATHNAPAIRCYTRCGFTVYGVDPQTILHEGVYYDELLMSRAV